MSDNPFENIPEFPTFTFPSVKPTGTIHILPPSGGLEPMFYYRVPKKYFIQIYPIKNVPTCASPNRHQDNMRHEELRPVRTNNTTFERSEKIQ